MSTHVQQQSSAFKPSVEVSPVDLIRQKKILVRDDSGIFSASPSPLTPSRTLSVFPPASSVPSTSEKMSAARRESTGGSPSKQTAAPPSQPGRGSMANARSPVQAPSQEDPLFLAFSCRSRLGPQQWARCSQTNCRDIHSQWQHLGTCAASSKKEPCKRCNDFQRLVLVHATLCQNDSCIVTLCPDAKRQLQEFGNSARLSNGHNVPPKVQRSNSVQDSLGESKHSQFISLGGQGFQGSFDDTASSPVSPQNYLESRRQLHQIGVGGLPMNLVTSYQRKAESIVKRLELEQPFEHELPPTENLQPPAPSKYPAPSGVLSPIEEHPALLASPTVPKEGDCFPSQTILHHLVPGYLTVGVDSHYRHRRDYDLNEHLGTGGFGTCAAARDHTTDKMFVIKSNKQVDDNSISSLQSECNILSRVPYHENITRFLGAVLEEDGMHRHCRIMLELAEHGSLADMLKDEEEGMDPLPLDQSLYYLQQILNGLYHLHSNNIVHLDIKAENVLVLEGGRRVKLADFGTAVHIDEIAGALSKLGGCTAHFTAPEIIRGHVPSFSSDIWSTVCVLIQLITARLPGCYRHTLTRENMLYLVGFYKDEDIEKLIPLSEMTEIGLDDDVLTIFHDALREDSHSRPSALQLLSYPALVNACEYEQYFDIECTQMSEQEVDTQSGVGLSLEGAESSSYHTPPTSLPLLITGPGEDSDVSLDMPLKKRVSQDSGVSRGGLDRTISEVSSMIDTGTDDSGIDTPSVDVYPRGSRQLIVRDRMKMAEGPGMIVEDREGEEQLTSIPDRTVSHPETSQDFAAIHGEHRRRSLSATYQRRTSLQEGAEPRFGRTYPDTNEDFFSLPPSTALKPRPSFVHLIHSNSAPVVMSDDEGAEGGAVHRTGSFRENGNGAHSRLRRSSSEVYVDRGPEIDTPEEKKKKKELALAKQAEEQRVAEGDQSSLGSQSSPSFSNHSQSSSHPSSGSQSDRSISSGNSYPHNYRHRPAGPTAAGNTQYVQRQGGGYTQETLV